MLLTRPPVLLFPFANCLDPQSIIWSLNMFQAPYAIPQDFFLDFHPCLSELGLCLLQQTFVVLSWELSLYNIGWCFFLKLVVLNFCSVPFFLSSEMKWVTLAEILYEGGFSTSLSNKRYGNLFFRKCLHSVLNMIVSFKLSSLFLYLLEETHLKLLALRQYN